MDDVLAKLAASAVDVTSQSLTREDVTDQYTDLNAVAQLGSHRRRTAHALG
ncbi:MAG: hypothetical protein R2851_13705 [Caldilineaceae bacterium]